MEFCLVGKKRELNNRMYSVVLLLYGKKYMFVYISIMLVY